MTKRMIVIALIAIFLTSCAPQGYLTEMYSVDFYHIPKLLPDETLTEDPTFIVYGDNQATWRFLQKFLLPRNWATWKMAIFPFYELYWIGNGLVGVVNWELRVPDYGQKTRLMVRDRIYTEWLKGETDFILSVGDITANDGRRPSHWAMFLNENYHDHPLYREAPLLPTPGNHDMTHNAEYGIPNYDAVFDYPTFYVIESPNMALFIVNANIIVDWHDQIPDDEQERLFLEWFVSGDEHHSAWLESKLAEYADKPFKVISMHQSPVSFGYHWRDWYKSSYGRNTPEKKRALLQLFHDNQVDLVFSGHDHLYQHSVLQGIDDVSFGNHPIHFVVSSGGGVTLRDPASPKKRQDILRTYADEGYDVDLLKYEPVFHYCVVEVNDEQLVVKTYTAAEDSSQDRQLIDELILNSD
ncbi:metallophosphoesterase [bacterium]|nr:metallophosphoesterase [bacterium]